MIRKTALFLACLCFSITINAFAADVSGKLRSLYDGGKYGQLVNQARTLAAKNNPMAQYYLGRCYELGHGVAQDYDLAVKFYELAAAQNNLDAIVALAFMYEAGNGVPKDMNSAVRWMNVAAEQGDWRALDALSNWHRMGLLN